MAANSPEVAEKVAEYKAREALTAVSSLDRDELPTPAELEAIKGLRTHFVEQLSQIKDQPACCFGDLALTRIIRGNDGDSEKTVKWFERFLETYQKEDVAKLIAEMAVKLEKAGPMGISNADLPHDSELKELASATFVLPKLAPSGDILTYIPLINTDKRGIADQGLFEKYAYFMRCALILRMLQLEALSREQGRMVKVVTVLDLAGCTLGWLHVPNFDALFDQFVGKFSEHICAELYGQWHIINAPWFVTKLYRMFKRYMPERFRRKINFIEGEPAQSADLLRLVGGAAQLQLMLLARADRSSLADRNSGEEELARGQLFERCLDAKPGQVVSWRFKVVAGSGDRLMGASDLEFQVLALWTSDEGDDPPLPPSMPSGSPSSPGAEDIEGVTLVEPRKVSAAEGEVSGSYEVGRPGLLIVRWSNAHSYLRGKTLSFNIEVTGP